MGLWKEKSFSRKGSFPLPRLSSGGEAAQKEFVSAGSSHQQDKIINKNELNEKIRLCHRKWLMFLS